MNKMREIKFRGHNAHHWCYGRLDIIVLPESVGQYTGFSDAQGNEIYEGDIISFPDWVTDEFGDFVPVKNIARVIFNTVSGAWEIEDCLHRRGSTSPMLSLLPRDGLKVIGNMFENAEMLKGEAK